MSDQNTPYICIDAVPKSISVSETYVYDLQIRANPETRLIEDPEGSDHPRGLVRIELPYDGYKYFPSFTAYKINQHASIGKQLDGQIGWLALGNPLDWEGNWDPQPGTDALLPVRVPLLSNEITDPEFWSADELCAVVSHEYAPSAPRFFPLQIEMRVFDSAEDYPDSFKNTIAKVEKAGDAQGILDLLNGDPLQGGQLVIDLTITTYIPTMLARREEGQEDVQVYLEELSLKWPTIASEWQVSIKEYKDGAYQDVSWRYNPDKASIEIKNLKATPSNEEKGSTLRPYHCWLRFYLITPGKIVSEDELEGLVRLRLDGCLLSSRQVALLDARGMRIPRGNQRDQRKRSEILTTKTMLKAHFLATLSEQFQQRRSAVYRQWYFHGLKFSTARLDDMAAALRDIGFQITDSPPPIKPKDKSDKDKEKDKDAYSVGVIAGERYEVRPDSQPAWLQIQVWAIPVASASTRREREIPEGGIVSTEMDTSDMILQVRGQINGPGSLLALDVEKLMTNLKNRFTAIVDLR